MTDTELDARLEQLSDDDLQILAKNGYLTGLHDCTIIVRLCREILDLRTQLAEFHDEDAYSVGMTDGVIWLCSRITDILDGNDNRVGTTGQPWDSVRRKLLALVKEKSPCPPA